MSGTERGFACLGHDTISVNLLRPCIKRNQSIDRKIAKEGWSQEKNWRQEQRGRAEKGGCIENGGGGRGVEEREYPCGPLERTPGFIVAGREADGGDTTREGCGRQKKMTVS